MMEFSLLCTTTDSRVSAERLAEILVTERLAGCAHIVAVSSLYVWKDALERTEEWALQLKVRSVDLPLAQKRLRAAHSYETPEIVVIPIIAGDPTYLDWLRAATQR